MLSALAPSGPVAQPVPPSPPSTTDHAQPVQRESFQDVYRNVPSEEESQRDAGQKQKSDGPTVSRPRKSSAGDGNDQAPVTAIPALYGVVLQKAPLAFTLPSLGIEVVAPPVVDDSAISTDGEPHSASSSPDNTAILAGASNVSVPLAQPEPAAGTLVPAAEKLAFSARLTQPDTAPNQTPAARGSIAPPSRPQMSSDARTNTEPAAPFAGKDAYQTADVKKLATPEAVRPVRESSSASILDLRQPAPAPQPSESIPQTPARSLAIHDVQAALPETPKPPASTEILLQLGQNQSTASVRVVDRSGTVNVTVHAADPDLRSSLRSNLSDLASQLTGQGYKTEMIKPAVIAANADNQHDSRQSGRDGSGQQQHQFTPDGRQPQRDRRANSEQWYDDLEQETSGTAGATGGKS